jgi:tRNA threonylcarbamoyladenosine biosynthesis protein TsaB
MKKLEKSQSRKILYLETGTDNSTIAVLVGDKIVAKKTWDGRGELSETLLLEVDNLLSNIEMTLSDISLITVNPGPGSYTGLRIGLSTANAISWSKSIPIVPARLINGKMKFLSGKNDKLVSPLYNQPPKITKSKKI